MDTLMPDGGGGRHRDNSRNTRQSVYVPSPEPESLNAIISQTDEPEHASDTLQSDGLSAVSAQAGVQVPQPNHRSSLAEKRHPDNSHNKHKVLGNYVLARTIGEGSFAKVKLAYHRLTNQQVKIGL
jgi:hypothetical protein